MNRTTLIITIGIIIAVCTGIYFWTEWQKQEFDASLPKPPTDEQQQSADDTAGGHWHGDEWHAEPPVADEAPPVQTVTQPVETDEMEAARQREEAPKKLPLVQPDELDLEREAIRADLDALIEQEGTLSLAEFQKGIDDIVKRQNAWHDKFNKQAEEAAASIREREAERKPAAVGDR